MTFIGSRNHVLTVCLSAAFALKRATGGTVACRTRLTSAAAAARAQSRR